MTTYPVVSRTKTAGWRQPRLEWPRGAKTLFVLAIDFDGPSHDVGQGFYPLGSRATGRYSGRRGVARYLELLKRKSIKATFFIPGYDAECYPDVVRSIADQGHEVGAHGYLHEHKLFPAAEERARLSHTHEVLRKLTGRYPAGWRSPSGQKTLNTLLTLHELGYVYDSSDKDFDVPFMLDLDKGKQMVEIPNNTYSLDDFPFYQFSMTPVSEVLEVWKAEFDAIHAERGFYVLSLHPRCGWGSGTPSRAAMVEQMIDYARSFEGVEFVTMSEVAAWAGPRAAMLEEVAIR